MITYRDLKKNELEKLEDLWNRNSQIHSELSRFFKKKFDKTMFQKRMSSWVETDTIKISTAGENSHIIGYCISSINDGAGLIESLFVHPGFRKQGMGRKLVENHIEWFKTNRCSSIEVTTVYGNDPAIAFYKSVGIYPQTISMRLK